MHKSFGSSNGRLLCWELLCIVLSSQLDDCHLTLSIMTPKKNSWFVCGKKKGIFASQLKLHGLCGKKMRQRDAFVQSDFLSAGLIFALCALPLCVGFIRFPTSHLHIGSRICLHRSTHPRSMSGGRVQRGDVGFGVKALWVAPNGPLVQRHHRRAPSALQLRVRTRSSAPGGKSVREQPFTLQGRVERVIFCDQLQGYYVFNVMLDDPHSRFSSR